MWIEILFEINTVETFTITYDLELWTNLWQIYEQEQLIDINSRYKVIEIFYARN